MKRVRLFTGLTREEQRELAARCHFNAASLPQIEALHGALLPLLRPEGVYDVPSGGRTTALSDICAAACNGLSSVPAGGPAISGVDGDACKAVSTADGPAISGVGGDACKAASTMGWPASGRFALCAVTLGEFADRMQDVYSMAGAVEETYILECISNSLLEKAYGELGAHIWRETGLFLNAYYFPGSDMPIETVRDIVRELAEGEKAFPVSCSEACILLPRKSVVFLGGLGTVKKDCGICESCHRGGCEFRRQGERK